MRHNIDNLKKNEYKSDESIEQLNEKVIMLEKGVSTRDIEIDLFREKLGSFEASTSCKVCASETDSEESRLNEDVPTTSKCGDCDYDSQDESDMKKHMQSTHQCECKVCSIVFINAKLLTEHLKKEHESSVDRCENETQDVEKVKCPECEYTAKSLYRALMTISNRY